MRDGDNCVENNIRLWWGTEIVYNSCLCLSNMAPNKPSVNLKCFVLLCSFFFSFFRFLCLFCLSRAIVWHKDWVILTHCYSNLHFCASLKLVQLGTSCWGGSGGELDLHCCLGHPASDSAPLLLTHFVCLRVCTRCTVISWISELNSEYPLKQGFSTCGPRTTSGPWSTL